VYKTDLNKTIDPRVAAYDTEHPPWGATSQDGWCPVGGQDYMAGSFVWTG
jgi:hypothetical protein